MMNKVIMVGKLGNDRPGGSYLRLIGPHSRDARQLGWSGGMPPQEF